MNAVSKQLNLFMEVLKSSQRITVGIYIDTAFPIAVLRERIQKWIPGSAEQIAYYGKIVWVLEFDI